MQRLLKHKLLIGLLAVFAVAGGGAAYAATQTGPNSRQALLNDVAKRLHVSPSRLRSAIQGALLDRLNAAVKAGQLTQAQANALKQKIEKGGLPIGPFVGRGFPPPIAPGPKGQFAPPTGRFAPRTGRFAPPAGVLPPFGPLAAAARYLGISRNQLLSDLRSKTLAQVAQARGKSVSGLEKAILSAHKTRLDRLVSAGVLTKAQEQRQLTFLGKAVARLVEHARVSLPPAGKPLFRGGPPPPTP